MPDLPDVPRRIVIAAALLAMVVVLGTAGYVAIEGWGWFDSLYMTITTFTTVGNAEAPPLSVAGKVWTMVVVLIGFGVLTYTLLALIGYVLEGQLGIAVHTRRMRRQVARMREHFVLCGYGRVGREIAREFTAEGIAFVVIDINEESLTRAAREGHRVIVGSASDVGVLSAAGIDRARGLVTAIDNDAENIYVTLSARVLRPDIFIVARANSADSEPKLRLAGANRIISPYTIGGRRMASLAMRPTAVEFFDKIMSASNAELLLEDMTIAENWAGKTLAALAGEDGEAIVLAIKRGETMMFHPPATTLLQVGDEVVAAGPTATIRALERRLAE